MKHGYYWIQLAVDPGVWCVGCLEDEGRWFTCGNEVEWGSGQVTKIGAYIEPPA